METFVQYDAANRVQFVRRGAAASPIMTAEYTYHNDDRVHTVTYGNDTSIEYLYDDARGRLYFERRGDQYGQDSNRVNFSYDLDGNC